ncbi:hypothetical protein PHET_07857 [Paragonimus heterotremus]|uniref:Uncharacterized protein n=1 Tax=Paragonimus heterotremus TaxID=100268 RepID=A0A8J4SMI7_9TREM|nr:hypothetical protein PHET_07857 [Paragonimus heterotremus]
MFSTRSRETSKERTKTKAKSKETHQDSFCGSFGRRRATEHTPLTSRRPTETVRPRGRCATLTNTALADSINASIRLRREITQKKYNPLNPELDLPVGGNRGSPSPSIRSTTRRRPIHPLIGNARNRSPGPASPDSDNNADPPTSTNDPVE